MDARSRLLVFAIGLCLLAWAGRAAAQEKSGSAKLAEPDLRYVEVDRAHVYAGPSEDYYPTSFLTRGASVTVFEQTQDGWLAIRPPKGSFSWLPATQGFLLPGGRTVEVTEAEAVSWIGSSLGTPKQYRWQVRLNRGEQLTVIGEQTLGEEESDKKTLWYKISPPNGEFRWIRAEACSASMGAESVAVAGSSSNDGEADGVVPAGGAREVGPQSILQTSGEEPIDGVLSADQAGDSRIVSGSHSRSPQGSGQGGQDRWATWHAVEFKNGSFSFPGVARMLGMEPAPPSGSGDSYDPFDVATAATMGRRAPTSDDAAGAPGTAEGNRFEEEGTAGPVGPRKPRGWRDPRQLREMREQGRIRGDLAYAGSGDPAVGSGVITASATGSAGSMGDGMSSPSDDAQWYGIVQAPQASAYQPLQLQQADLGEVQLRLSEMVAGPEHTWNLAPLADRTRYLVEHGSTAVERGEARLLLDRIQAFADVARRSVELGMTSPVALPAGVNASISASPSAAAATQWASPLGLTAAPTEATSGNAPRFDATGWVVPVHSTNPDMPTHALTNDAGRIIVYLTPAPGVNLSRYQAQAIGVYGLRGYLPQLKANHIQVQRAVRLH